MEQHNSLTNSSPAEKYMPAGPDSDVIDLRIIAKFASENWRVFLACIALGMGLSVVLYFILPARWEATATLKIGSVPASVSSNDVLKFEVIETPSEIVAKLSQRDTVDKVIATIQKLQEEGKNIEQNANLIRDTLKATVVKNTDFIVVATSAYSSQKAEQALGAVVKVILESHQEQFSRIMTRFKEKIQAYNEQIDSVKRETGKLEIFLNDYEKLKSPSQFGQNIAAMNLLAIKKTELNELSHRRNVLEDKIASANTYPTAVVSRVYAGNSPYFPNLSLFLLLGCFLGFLLGLAFALYINHKKNRISNQA